VKQEYRYRGVMSSLAQDLIMGLPGASAADLESSRPASELELRVVGLFDESRYVKDQLETYLHQQVCAGKLDLKTAQRDIATDWISAYKRYFHVDRPASNYSAPNLGDKLGPTT